jgi:hypothetical protein
MTLLGQVESEWRHIQPGDRIASADPRGCGFTTAAAEIQNLGIGLEPVPKAFKA